MTKANLKASKIKTLDTFFPDCSFTPSTVEPARIARFSAQEQRTRISKLEKIAERLTTRIEELRNPAIAQLNVTARRASIAASMYQDSERLALLKEKILAMIKLIESNNLPRSLAHIKDRTQLELLLDAVTYDRDYRCHYPRVQREDLEKVRSSVYRNTSSPNDDLVIKIDTEGEYYLYWEMTFQYSVIGIEENGDPTKLYVKSECGPSAYAGTGDSVVIIASNELKPEWAIHITSIELTGNAVTYTGYKTFTHSCSKVKLGYEGYNDTVEFTLDAYAQAGVNESDITGAYVSAEIRYWDISIKWFIFESW